MQHPPTFDGSVTNVLQVTLSAGSTLSSADCRYFEGFGEVMRLTALPADASTAEVVYYDVRAAISASEALGRNCCKPARQVGNRIVPLPGSATLRREDCKTLASVQKDPLEPDSGFLLEFYDIRDAKRCQANLVAAQDAPKVEVAPPGLVPPPGLEAGVDAQTQWSDARASDAQWETPPGWEPPSIRKTKKRGRGAKAPKVLAPPGLIDGGDNYDALSATCSTAASTPPQAPVVPHGAVAKVTVSGLPNHILSKAMFEAVLQQSNIEDYVMDYTIVKGNGDGIATVYFPDFDTANWCAVHFNGCRWVSSGPVTATVSAATPVAFLAHPIEGTGVARLELSASAPAFVPHTGGHLGTSTGKIDQETKVGVSSDTSTEVSSTEVGDSEGSDTVEADEKEQATVTAK
jgi:hypothetical protein